MTTTRISPIGRVIHTIRRQRGLKLAAVRHVSVSTLNAIERGRMVPSLSLTDTITRGLDLEPGALDLPLLASVHDAGVRVQLVKRLLGRNVPPLAIQRTLRQVAMDPDMALPQRAHAQLLVAQVLDLRGARRRAVLILTYLARTSPPLPGTLHLEVISTLGKCYLRLEQPEQALSPLMEAVQQPIRHAAWESALCNLGLAWWKVGQYAAAEAQWQRAIEEVADPARLANAYLGLGLLAFRKGRLLDAISAYHQTLTLYEETNAAATQRLRVLNNLLACHVQQQDWRAADAVVGQGAALPEPDPVVWGEWLTTQAECAWAQGRRQDAQVLIAEAKESLGNALVVSWFTIRLLELRILAPSEPAAPLVQAIEEQLSHVSDRELIGALHTMLVQAALEAGRLDEVQSRVRDLRSLFPIIN